MRIYYIFCKIELYQMWMQLSKNAEAFLNVSVDNLKEGVINILESWLQPSNLRSDYQKYRWILYQANISRATNFLRSEI